MASRRPKTISIFARRWFQKSAGNTYHSVTIYVDGEEVHYEPFEYGYGTQYQETAARWLYNNGYLPGLAKNETLWRYAQRKGIKFNEDVAEVSRKKDL